MSVPSARELEKGYLARRVPLLRVEGKSRREALERARGEYKALRDDYEQVKAGGNGRFFA
jgi:hypothetical protein